MASILKVLDISWTVATRAIAAIAALAVIVVVYRDISGGAVTIEPLDIPKHLRDAGFSPEHVASQLRFDLLDIRWNAPTTMRDTSIRMGAGSTETLPDVVVPGTGISIGGLSGWINARLLSPDFRAR
jgi:hypothetical protein